MSFSKVGEFRTGGTNTTDARSINNNEPNKAPDNHMEQMRQKLGTEFTADKKRDTGKKRNELGKDDFMKLMSAQLKYQDPTSPMKNEQMAAQLAQFSALEQMMNVNQNLEKMTAGQKPSEHMIAASLIGKRVTTDTRHILLEKGGSPEVGFDLPEDAVSVNVAVVSSKGEVVRELELGEMQKGPQSVRWDGKNSKAQEQPLGDYSYRVSAADKNGKPLDLKSDNTGLVSGVTFEGGKSLLIVDGKKVPIESVGRIESDTQGESKAAAQAAGAAVAAGVDAMGAGGLAPPEGAKRAAQKTGAASSSEPVKAVTANKQNKSSSANGAATSTQVAKNNLPAELSPEKIKSMLASMGMSQASDKSEGAAATERQEENPMPLWNPANN